MRKRSGAHYEKSQQIRQFRQLRVARRAAAESGGGRTDLRLAWRARIRIPCVTTSLGSPCMMGGSPHMPMGLPREVSPRSLAPSPRALRMSASPRLPTSSSVSSTNRTSSILRGGGRLYTSPPLDGYTEQEMVAEAQVRWRPPAYRWRRRGPDLSVYVYMISLRSPYHVHADVCIDSRPGPPAIVHAGTPQAQRAVAADETAPGCFIGGRTVRGDEGPPDGRQARQAGAQPTPLSGRPTRAVTLVHTPSSHTPIALPSLMRAVPCILLGSAPRAFLVHPHMYVYPSSSVLI